MWLARALRTIESARPFRETEAWVLFRLAAFGEAIGWTLLISGIGLHRYNLPGGNYSVPIAGQIHGTLFLLYFGILLATYSSLRWPRWQFLLALTAGVVPYGTLAFEIWASYQRRTSTLHGFIASITLASLR